MERDLFRKREFDKRLSILESLTRRVRAIEAYRWYEANKEQFKEPVYVPLLSMEMKYVDSASYLENVIASRDFLIFICGCREDERLLTDAKHPWQISSTFLSEQRAMDFVVEKRLDDGRMRGFGFERTALELFHAPTKVKAFLNQVASLSNIPIGNDQTEQMIGAACEALKDTHRLFLTPESKVQIRKSLYREGISSKVSALYQIPRCLKAHEPISSPNMDESRKLEIRQLEDLQQKSTEMQERLEAKKKALRNIAIRKEEIRKELTEISLKGKALRSAMKVLHHVENSLKNLDSEKPDLESAKEATKNIKQNAINKVIADIRTSNDLLIRQNELTKRRLFVVLQNTRKKQSIEEHNVRIDDLNEELNDAKNELAENMEKMKGMEEKAEENSRKLFQLTKLSSTKEKKLNIEQINILEKLKREWTENNVPDSLDELEEAILTDQARLEIASTDGTAEDIKHQEELLKERDELVKQICSAENEIAGWRDKMDELLEKWLKHLEKLLGMINERFTAFLEQLNCNGEVHLEKPEDNKYDIEQYGLVLLVKFRDNGPLRQLTQSAQSGGERSVATMLYLMALQELSPVPFRCVDEINQGMDPETERRVIQFLILLLNAPLTNLSKTQYFLASPRIVRHLDYGNNCCGIVVCELCREMQSPDDS